jgi:colicin import membrane protein
MTYDHDDYVTDRERKIARWLAVAMHAGFVLLLVFGVAWQKRHSEPAAIVDLWSSMSPPRQEPPPPAPRPEPRIAPKPEVKAPPPKPEVKPDPKPDIALRERLEKERKAKEQQELEKKKLEQKKAEEAKKLKAAQQQAEDAKKLKTQQQAETKKKEDALEKERLQKDAEAKRLAQEKDALASKLAKERSSAQQALNDKYITLIQNHVKRQIVEPPNLQGNPQVEFDVVLIPGGEVLTVKLRRSSGVPAYDAAVERAILKASPLPLPPDPTLFQQFRELNLKIRPRE